MKWRKHWRTGQGYVVVGSYLAVTVLGRNLDPEVQAPLFAIIAAMGLSLVSSVRDHRWSEFVRQLVKLVTVASAASSGFQWLRGADAGLVIEVLGLIGATLATVALLWNSGRG